MGVQAMLSRPVSTIDPFSHDFLNDPYPHHEAFREAGPAVWLDRYGIWAMARHEQVRDALTDWQTYCSSAGVGLSDFRKEPPWRPPSIILEADPPLHTRTRAVLTRILSPAAINVLRDRFEREADALVDRLVEAQEFDGVAELAEAYPLKVFPDAVGLAEDGRENLMPYGTLVFNSFGPRNDLLEKAMVNGGPVRDWIMSKCSRAALAPDGLGIQIYHAVDAGEIVVAPAVADRAFRAEGAGMHAGKLHALRRARMARQEVEALVGIRIDRGEAGIGRHGIEEARGGIGVVARLAQHAHADHVGLELLVA